MKFDWVDPDSITYCTKCDCGAITVTINGKDYSMKTRTFKQVFGIIPSLKYKNNPQTFACNHCVNHWGIDICACGSGMPVGKCKEGFNECGQPMQIIDKYTCVRAANAWGLPR